MVIQLYHPLNGQELLKWIMSEMEKNLSGHYVFGIGMAYHNPTFTVNIKVDAHSSLGNVENTINPTLSVETMTDPTITGLKTEKKEFELSVSEPLLEPDRARDAMGEPRYVTEKVAGVMVDTKSPKEEPHTPEEMKKAK